MQWGILANGLRYAILPNNEPADKVSLRLLVGVGSLAETEDELGLAHYLEHLAFNGSKNFPPGTLIETLQGWGMGFGNNVNAHTSFDETVYKLDLPDTQPETLARGLQVIADYAGRLTLSPEEVEKERGVILAEMRDRNSPGYVFGELNLPQRIPAPTLPNVSDWRKEIVEITTAELMRDFYERYYRPANMVLTVVGAVDLEAAVAAIQSEFAALPSEELVSVPVLPPLAPLAEQILSITPKLTRRRQRSTSCP